MHFYKIRTILVGKVLGVFKKKHYLCIVFYKLYYDTHRIRTF